MPRPPRRLAKGHVTDLSAQLTLPYSHHHHQQARILTLLAHRYDCKVGQKKESCLKTHQVPTLMAWTQAFRVKSLLSLVMSSYS